MAEVDKITPVFKIHTIHNEGKSKAEGRPIYDDMEVVEVHIPGNRDTIGVYPALSVSHWAEDAEGNRIAITYAARWPDQYRRFKENKEQIASGTPLSELPFLTEAKRMELRALKVYTAEQLADLDGQNLKVLGQGGRGLKDQAQAYLDASTDSSRITSLAANNAAQKERIEQLEADIKAMQTGAAPKGVSTKPVSPFDAMPDDELKQFIKDKTGQPLKGNHGRETLVRMANEANGGDDNA